MTGNQQRIVNNQDQSQCVQFCYVILCGSRRPGCCCGGVQPFQILVKHLRGVEKPMINDSLSSTISCATRFNPEKALCNDAKEEISCQNRDGNKQIMIPSVVISQAL